MYDNIKFASPSDPTICLLLSLGIDRIIDRFMGGIRYQVITTMYLGLTLRPVRLVLKYFNGQGDADKMHFLWTHGSLHVLKGPVVFLNIRQCVQLLGGITDNR